MKIVVLKQDESFMGSYFPAGSVVRVLTKGTQNLAFQDGTNAGIIRNYRSNAVAIPSDSWLEEFLCSIKSLSL